ncbi:MAG: DNA methylase [Bacilli bacterium]|nr:DNA methylase [Bacilli bacterium]
MQNRTYIAIDLKSFYASSEASERHLDPLTTNLVVADISRTEKTICLAISPSMKELGLPGRARLFEVIQKVKEINAIRRKNAPGHRFTGKSYNAIELANNPSLELDYVIACPQMAKYIEVSSKIYSIYLKYISSEDIHVYSIDEVFMDVTTYLNMYKMSAHELAMKMIRDVLKETGITATAGIGTNLYLAKVAMDIVAKHIPADKDGVRIAELDEIKYRELLWEHRPLTSFWRVGRGYVNRLESNGMFTMGDVARMSLVNEDKLYEIFGINAELLINHAWGYEPCTIKDIKEYKSDNHSQGIGQVLSCGYTYEKAKIIVKEMAEALSLDLVAKKTVGNVVSLGFSYDAVKDGSYQGELSSDWYGKEVPKAAHGSIQLFRYTSSTELIRDAAVRIFERIVNKKLLIHRINIAMGNVIPEDEIKYLDYEQLDLFSDFKEQEIANEKLEEALKEEKKLQETILNIKNKYGKNSLIKGTDLQEGATTLERNQQIGGHKA